MYEKWDTPELAWTEDHFKRFLNSLKEDSKKMDVQFHVAVYTNDGLAPSYRTAFALAGYQRVHTLHIRRVDEGRMVVGDSLVLVGSHQHMGSAPTGDVLMFSVPPLGRNTTWTHRPDIDYCKIEKKHVGVRRRCVEEFRYLVREYSRPGSSVICSHSGDGSAIMAALLEGRHAYGLDNCDERNQVAEFRLSEMARIEEELAKKDTSEPVIEDDPEIATITDMSMEEALDIREFEAPTDDKTKLLDLIREEVAAHLTPCTWLTKEAIEAMTEKVVGHCAQTAISATLVQDLLGDGLKRYTWLSQTVQAELAIDKMPGAMHG